ncbi:MAG: amidohydrolase family protein [Bacillota bacterium]
MSDILLSEFMPECCLEVSRTEISKSKFPVIDAHAHMGILLVGKNYEEMYDTGEFMEYMRQSGVYKVINADGVYDDEFTRMLNKTKGFEDEIYHLVWIDHENIDDPGFAKTTRKRLIEEKKLGAKGIKIWKMITLRDRDKSGKPIRTDDDRMQVVYETAAELDMPLLMHIADPVAFFRPIDNRNERIEELGHYPDWSFYGKQFPSFNELMDMQDNMIEKNPHTKFIMAHCGSYAENLAHVSERLERYKNMYVDIAARIAELGRQPYSARKFFIRHSDRILFGSDSTPNYLGVHKIMYRFLETYDEYFPYWRPSEMPMQGRWHVYGIGLPDEALKNIYYKNAAKLFNLEFPE